MEKQKNAKPYLTRKNLIVIALAFFYTILFVFVGMCIDAGHGVISKNNIIKKIGENLFNFNPIDAKTSGFIMLLLAGVYISLFVFTFIYERRFAIVNGKSARSVKMIVIYILTFVACGGLSIGLGLGLLSPIKVEDVKLIFEYLGQVLILTTVLYAAVFLLVGAAVMLVVNFLLIDKPFKFFSKKSLDVIEDEEEEAGDVSLSFDADASLNGAGVNGGVGTGFGGVAPETITSRAAVEELDDREKVFPSLCQIDNKYDGYPVEHMETDTYNLEEICIKFRNYLAKEEKLYFDLDTIRIFISSFGTSHLMILEGLSGTGKSSLPRYFAKFANARVLFAPVQATWRDRTNILGYFNDFSKTYTETEFLNALYEANYNPDQISIFVLDEMNISRVEYYFADFLSVLEYPVEDWKLKVMQLPFNFLPPAKLDNGYIQIPAASYFVGTANKDDSTFSISDKVYDRAITIDFDDKNEAFVVNEDASPINISASHFQGLFNEALANEDIKLTEEDLKKFQKITEFIYDEFDITFGNRILNQITTLVPIFIACGGKKEDALDFLLSRKVIYKIEGRFEDYVKKGLKNLLVLLEKTYGAGVFKKSERAINSLIKRL